MEIKETQDYEKFSFINGNRLISQRKVERIVRDVKNGLNLFPYCPIVVNKNNKNGFVIIDGQHRFVAAKLIKHPIHFVVAKNIPLRDIARMNSNTDKWKASDFLDCYIRLGMNDYQVLKDFIKKYSVQLRTSLCLLMKGEVKGGGQDSESFKDGKFKVNFLDESKKLIELTDRLFGEYIFSRDSNLLEAVHRLQKKALWDVDVLEEKIHKHRNMMDKQSSVKTYIYLIEQIYNMRNQKRKSIF